MMLMPIGRFARAARLSIKSLRNYHDSGLLPAAFVDPDSGYRYYRMEQLARAEAIRSLRLVGMSLPEIEATLGSDDPEPRLLSHLASLEHQRDELTRRLQQLQRQIDRKDYVMSREVTTKIIEPLTALSHRRPTDYPGIFEDIPNGLQIVVAALHELDIDPVGTPFTLYHQVPDADSSGDIAMCVPVDHADGSVELSGVVDGPVEAIEIGGGAVASIVHHGSYDDMGESYATVSAWIHERGHRIIGPHRELYLNSPADVAEADLLTEVQFPIEADGEL